MSEHKPLERRYVYIEQLIFKARDSDFKIIKASDAFRPDGQSTEIFTAKGNIVYQPDTRGNGYVTLYGNWIDDPKYGKQLDVASSQEPFTLKMTVKQLDRPEVTNVGERTIKRIYDALQPFAFERMIANPRIIQTVKKVSPKRLDTLHAFVKKHRESLDEYSRFFALGFNIYEVTYIQRLLKINYKQLTGDPFSVLRHQAALSSGVIKDNPEIIVNITFKRLDGIIINNRLPFTEAERAHFAAQYAFSDEFELLKGGDTVFPFGVAKHHIKTKLLDGAIDETIIEAAITDNDEIVYHADNREYQSRKVYDEESDIAEFVDSQRAAEHVPISDTQWDALIKDTIDAGGVKYDPQQQSAIRTALESNIMLLTGGPGTGKTTVVNAIITAIRKKHGGNTCIYGFAPTGKAAKRMNEAVDGRIPTNTVHKLIHSEDLNKSLMLDRFASRSDVGYLIIDETSMIETKTLAAFIRKLNNAPGKFRIVFVGDVDQLPPISYGEPFKRMVETESIPKVKLHRIHRQSNDSKIIDIAYAIKDKQTIDFETYSASIDVNLLDRTPAEAVVNHITTLMAAESKPKDIQVITPFKRKQDISSNVLNNRLQPIMNPDYAEARRHGLFMEMKNGSEIVQGDRVIYTKNQMLDDEKQLVNGDTGIVEHVHPEKGTITVVLDSDTLGQLTHITKDYINDLELAYAITTHKSQGSEYKHVIIPVPGFTMPAFLTRNMLYTAATRAKETLTVFGNPHIFNQIAQQDIDTRAARLEYLLPQEEVEGDA